nr:DUF2807 domain-containing protein [Bacteroidota bacterium]
MKREITVQLSILIALVFIGFQLFGCGYTNAHVEKDVITQQREVEDFDGIIVSGAFNVFISQGDKQKVIVEAPEEIIEKIQTKVKSGKLEIGNDGRILCYNNIKIYV